MTNGVIDRFRTMPIASSRRDHRTRGREPGPQPGGHRGGDHRRPAGRLPADGRRRCRGSARSAWWPCGSWRSPGCSPPSGWWPAAPRPPATTASRCCSCRTCRAPSCRSRRCPPAAVVRRAPADHADHRDDPQPAAEHRAGERTAVGGRLVTPDRSSRPGGGRGGCSPAALGVDDRLTDSNPRRQPAIRRMPLTVRRRRDLLQTVCRQVSMAKVATAVGIGR